MKLFETSWREGFNFYERYYDTQLQRSMKSRVTVPYEWYEPASNGMYTYILDETIKLDKKQGNAKDGKDQYGFINPMYRNIRDNYWNKDQYQTEPRIWYLDIETRAVGAFPLPEKASQQITMIQIFDNKEDTIIMFGLREWKHQEQYAKNFEYPVKYIKCDDEIQLINHFINVFGKLDPLVLYAWNGDGFDFPYLYNRMKKLDLDPNRLSNYGEASLEEREFLGKTEFSFKSDGHYYIDLMDVYKKFILSPRPSYSLDTICEIELGENKVDHSEYAGFDDFYTGKYNIPHNPTEEQEESEIYKQAVAGNWDEVKELAHSEFCYYSYKDPLLIKKLDDKLNLTALMLMIVEKMGVLLSDALGTVRPWSQYILNKSYQDMIVMPPNQEFDNPHVVGGYVRDPNRGKHKWVISADVNSMYPLLGMVGFNMSSETYVPKHKLPPELRDIIISYFSDQDEEKRLKLDPMIWTRTTELLQENNLSLGINGAVFKKDKLGMVPEMVQDIYDSRKQAKKTMFKYQQRKILIKEIIKEKKAQA